MKLDLDITTAIGHARWATKGDVKVNANNHPVIEDGIMLVHNGVIDNDRELFRLFGDDYQPKAEVDSQVAAALLANPGIIYAEHVTDVLSLIEGSAAFAWLDMDDLGTLHLARCADRPLTIGETRRGDLVMSSTPETLEDLAMWSNIRIRKVREVEEGTYLRVVAGEIVEEQSFAVKRAKPKYSYTKGWTSPYGGSKTYGASLTTVSKPTLPAKPDPLTQKDALPGDWDYPHGEGDWYDNEKYFDDPADQDLSVIDGEVVDERDDFDPHQWDLEDEVIDEILAIHPNYDRQMLYELCEVYNLAASPWLDDDIDWDNLVMWRVTA